VQDNAEVWRAEFSSNWTVVCLATVSDWCMHCICWHWLWLAIGTAWHYTRGQNTVHRAVISNAIHRAAVCISATVSWYISERCV